MAMPSACVPTSYDKASHPGSCLYCLFRVGGTVSVSGRCIVSFANNSVTRAYRGPRGEICLLCQGPISAREPFCCYVQLASLFGCSEFQDVEAYFPLRPPRRCRTSEADVGVRALQRRPSSASSTRQRSESTLMKREDGSSRGARKGGERLSGMCHQRQEGEVRRKSELDM
eukprot:s3981_g3.t1